MWIKRNNVCVKPVMRRKLVLAVQASTGVVEHSDSIAVLHQGVESASRPNV